MTDLSFVRHQPLPELEPPSTQTGPVKWMRENLFNSWFNSILTLIVTYVIYQPAGRYAAVVPERHLERRLVAGMPRDQYRRLLRGDPRAVAAVPVRLLPARPVLAPDPRILPDVRRHGAGTVRGGIPQAVLADRRFPGCSPTG
jgi:hypothetical protein